MNQVDPIKELQPQRFRRQEIAERLKLNRKRVSKYMAREDFVAEVCLQVYAKNNVKTPLEMSSVWSLLERLLYGHAVSFPDSSFRCVFVISLTRSSVSSQKMCTLSSSHLRTVTLVSGRELQDHLIEAPTPSAKVTVLQNFLMRFFREDLFPDPAANYAVRLIQERRGLISVREISEKTGYSPRYLAMKFDRFVGLSPKTLAEVIRFQNHFGSLTPAGYNRAVNKFRNFFHREISDSYNTERSAGR